jgi:NhaP-type Na+/H+ or K+/H+ antiporter
MQEHPEPGSSPKGLWWKTLLAAWFGLSGIGAVAAAVGVRLPEELGFPVLAVAWVLVWMIWRRRVVSDQMIALV